MAKLKPTVSERAPKTAAPRAARVSPPLAEVPLTIGISYRVDEAARRIDIGKSKMWELVWKERIPARKIDGATVILHDDLVEFVRSSPFFAKAKADQ